MPNRPGLRRALEELDRISAKMNPHLIVVAILLALLTAVVAFSLAIPFLVAPFPADGLPG